MWFKVCSVLLFVLHSSLFHLTKAEIECGAVTVCVDTVDSGSRKVTFDLNLLTAVPDISKIDGSGYYYNFDTLDNSAITANVPTLSASKKIYKDSWNLTPGSGSVQIGFPFIRAYATETDACYGNFKFDFYLDDSDTSKVCDQQAVYRQSKVDFVLIVDTTGSMGDDIAQVKSDAGKIIDALVESSTTVRAAVVEYNDRVSPLPDAKILLPFSTNVEDFKAAVNSLPVEGAWPSEDVGGDGPECLYDGLDLAGQLPWDSTARRVTVTMGDAPGKVCDSGVTLDFVVFLYTSVVIDITPTTPLTSRTVTTPVTIKVPVKKLTPVTAVSTGSSPVADFSEISDKTEGDSVTSKDVADTVSKIITVIKGGDPKTTSIKDLTLELDCAESTATEHAIVVTNPNEVSVPATLREGFTRYNQKMEISPRRNVIRISNKSGRPSRGLGVQLTWKDENGKLKFKTLRKFGTVC